MTHRVPVQLPHDRVLRLEHRLPLPQPHGSAHLALVVLGHVDHNSVARLRSDLGGVSVLQKKSWVIYFACFEEKDFPLPSG